MIPALLSKAELVTTMPEGEFIFVDRYLDAFMGTIASFGVWFLLTAKSAFAMLSLRVYWLILANKVVKTLSRPVLFVHAQNSYRQTFIATRLERFVY